jgi:hypothetical protein
MAKTYVPTLKFLLKKVCNFFTVHRDTIVALVPEAQVYLDAIVANCNLAMPFLDAVTPPGG